MPALRSCSWALPPRTRKLAFQALALATICCIGFADMYSYSMPDSFLGQGLDVYMVYCLILLVELTPKQHLALSIAVLSAGCSAGDSVGGVLGAVVFDQGGLQAAFVLQTAVNALPLLLALLVLPAWPQPSDSADSCSSSSKAEANASCKDPSHDDQQAQQLKITDQQQAHADEEPQQQQRLDMRSVVATVRDCVVASQCLLVLLEQAVTSSVLVVLPVVMGTPTWLVGVVYTAMVVGAVAGPFGLEAYLSRKPAYKAHTTGEGAHTTAA
ncbi:hypothetical protein COO60DRAFT_1698779 [Scenedesmus sp. NREL 46B-D3]|nr:hypothetical protein COO60DRAFT_1698779 [Scenedesmus sp. NREL 46B-D3]